MLNIVNLEEVQRILLRVPDLVRDFENRDPNFIGSVKNWLREAEEILSNNRMAAAAGIAGLRCVLISAERGVMPPGLVFHGRTTPRKIKDASAADVMRKAQEQISEAIRSDQAQLAEGERLIRQLVALAQRKGLIPSEPGSGGHTETLIAIWRAIIKDPDLGPAATHLTGLVGPQDALILLDRMLSKFS